MGQSDEMIHVVMKNPTIPFITIDDDCDPLGDTREVTPIAPHTTQEFTYSKELRDVHEEDDEDIYIEFETNEETKLKVEIIDPLSNVNKETPAHESSRATVATETRVPADCDSKFMCSKCRRQFKTQYSAWSHKKYYCEEIRKRYKCPYCEFDSKFLYYTNRHMVVKHAGNDIRHIIMTDTPGVCLTKQEMKCSWKYRCSNCSIGYPSKDLLIQHLDRTGCRKK